MQAISYQELPLHKAPYEVKATVVALSPVGHQLQEKGKFHKFCGMGKKALTERIQLDQLSFSENSYDHLVDRFLDSTD